MKLIINFLNVSAVVYYGIIANKYNYFFLKIVAYFLKKSPQFYETDKTVSENT